MKKLTYKQERKRTTLANHQIVVLAAYLAGADSGAADTEDIAVKADELAPGRFTWRKYNNQINIDAVRKRLWDATKPEKGGYLIGSEKTGWRLTKDGFDLARSHIEAGDFEQPIRAPTTQTERAAQSRELNRMINEAAFLKILSGHGSLVTKSEAERFFRIDDYVTGKARVAKIERFRIIASDNRELSDAIEVLSRLLQET